MRAVTFESSAAHFQALTYTKMCCTGLECGQILTPVCDVARRGGIKVRINISKLLLFNIDVRRIVSAIMASTG